MVGLEVTLEAGSQSQSAIFFRKVDLKMAQKAVKRSL